MFRTLLTSGYSLMLIYVFWRAASVPVVVRHFSRKVLFTSAALLWTGYSLAFYFAHDGTGSVAAVVEFLSMTWLAVLFLCFVCLLATDLATRRFPGFSVKVKRSIPRILVKVMSAEIAVVLRSGMAAERSLTE